MWTFSHNYIVQFHFNVLHRREENVKHHKTIFKSARTYRFAPDNTRNW